MRIDISTFFKPSKSKILGRYSRLIRGDELTSNGFILFKSIFEPNWMSELKTKVEKKDIGKLLEVEKEKKLTKVSVSGKLEIAGDIIAELTDGEDNTTKSIWVNAYYLTFFMNLKIGLRSIATNFYMSETNNAVVVKWQDEIIGIIMPIRK